MIDEVFMKEALSEAYKAYEIKEVPIGAVIVKDGEIIGRGFNQKESLKDATLHSEITAIKDACNNLGGWRLPDCTMYVTLEPCPMCAGAIVNSRIERLVIGVKDLKSGACGSVLDITNNQRLNHQPEVKFGVLEEECKNILQDFFSKLRKDKKREVDMEGYPILELDLKKLYENTKIVTKLCQDCGIKVAGIIKGFGGIPEGAEEMAKGGCYQIGSSRIEQLKTMKERGLDIPLLLVRIPMMCEIEDVVKYSDISLVSEKETLNSLNAEAKKQNKIYGVVLMYDLGDLREGIFIREELIQLAEYVEYELKFLYLEGIGSNLSCYGSVAPTRENLSQLAAAAEEIEEILNRKLNIISGGGTTTLPLMVRGGVPKKINHLRIGEGINNTQDLPLYWDTNIEGLDPDVFILKAQIVELNEKPTHPIGQLMVNAFGDLPHYDDRGIRKRAIVALGNQDLGDSSRLVPRDKDMIVLGASSDHTILDIHDCKRQYKLGDIVEFNILYQAMLMTGLSDYVHKKIIKY
jgi:predicted amino acid racemase/tRNA(Arg) A34 adenosine deaminase TadA